MWPTAAPDRHCCRKPRVPKRTFTNPTAGELVRTLIAPKHGNMDKREACAFLRGRGTPGNMRAVYAPARQKAHRFGQGNAYMRYRGHIVEKSFEFYLSLNNKYDTSLYM